MRRQYIDGWHGRVGREYLRQYIDGWHGRVGREYLRQYIGLAMAILLACGLSACDRGSRPPAPPPTTQPKDLVALPAEKPDYSFAAGLADEHPEVIGFMRHFLETCLTGDYAGYRRLVARRTDPESRARFERVLHALRHLKIESIEVIAVRELPPPVYLVIAEADYVLDESAALRRRAGPRRVAMLIFKEEGEWRTAFAPAELQPVGEDLEPASAPATTSAPSYPWDEDEDY